MRGFFGIGTYQPKNETNSGTVFRTAQSYEANFVYTIGRKYTKQATDTGDATKNIPYFFYPSVDDLLNFRPRHTKIVCIELSEQARSLDNFCHPENAIYLLGNESYGIHQEVLDKSDFTVQISTPHSLCLNIAVAAGIVMYSRYLQMSRLTAKPIAQMPEVSSEDILKFTQQILHSQVP